MKCIERKLWSAEMAFRDYVARASDEALEKFETFYLKRSGEMMEQGLSVTHPDRQWVGVKLAILSLEIERREAVAECTAFFQLPWYKRLLREAPESYQFVYEEVAA